MLSALHRRVALATLVALAGVAGVVAGAPATTDDVSNSDYHIVSDGDIAASVSQSDATNDNENVTATFANDHENIVLHPHANQTVRLRTNAEAGTELKVELLRNGSLNRVTTAPVSENGTATAVFDLGDFEAERDVSLVVRHDDKKVAESPGVVRKISTELVHHGDPLVLRPAENETVQIRTDADPGRKLQVALKSDKFVRAVTATVSENGTATATFDLSDVESGTPITVSVFASDEPEFEGLVVNESATVRRNGTLTVDDPSSNYTVRGRVGDWTVTKLEVNVSSVDSTLDASRTVTVDGAGRFNATFDLSSLSAGTELSVDVGGVPRSVSELVVTEASRDATVFAFVETPLNLTVQRPGEAVLVRAASDQTIRGTTNLRPGTELVVTAENGAMNVPSDFSLSDTATVREDGTFAATLDFDEAEAGANFTVTVERGLPLAEVDGRVVKESAVIPTTTARTTTADEPTASTNSTTDGSSESSIPGFGVPVALVAVAAGLALARRN
ncbi:BGTF surface domain-containing protein [Halorussus sp. MSC15.2]|uniref:BGTF surface domain-containing protein n=1 Tax=Halorussus sp. MSC15.2 TaxID=2283638 RepID=UPI0013D27237|nr:BGTF surface domain-containing protein [Halorussus sp. MSC15.2]NEU55620.1 PGF-CTERM sorting domain-containing protein [Halorussus sp. MSC15.2]